LLELVDSHCHVNFSPLGENITEVFKAAQNNGVSHMLCVSVCAQDYPQVLNLATQFNHVFASVGVHPNETDEDEVDVQWLVNEAINNRVVAIGETGLDYFRSDGDLDWQRDRFVRHIQAAKQSELPLIIHMRDATDDTLRLMAEHSADQPGGVMHCFAEDWSTAKRALDLGFYISFSGIVTFKSATALQEVAQKAPLDRILVETDCPYLAPVPFRGKTNQPAYVLHTAEKVAELRGMSIEDVAVATTENFFTLFHKAQRIVQ
jgi:TatD DNase family protein